MTNFIRTQSNVTFFLDGAPYTVPSTHANFARVVEALEKGNTYRIKELLDVPAYFSNFTEGRVVVSGRDVTWNGQSIHNALATRIAGLVATGQSSMARPLCKFLDRLKNNPSFRAQTQLFDWLQATGLPIASDGRVIAYKIVSGGYRDIYSGKFDNSIGQKLRVERYEVDEDPNVTCSHGLHVCSEGYLPHYGTGPGSHVMIVAVDPADWVAVPTDYNNAKARVCAYEVIAECDRQGMLDAGLIYNLEPEAPEYSDEERIQDFSIAIHKAALWIETADGGGFYVLLNDLPDTYCWGFSDWNVLEISEDGHYLCNPERSWSMSVSELRDRA